MFFDSDADSGNGTGGLSSLFQIPPSAPAPAPAPFQYTLTPLGQSMNGGATQVAAAPMTAQPISAANSAPTTPDYLGQVNGLYQQFWGHDADNGMDNPWVKALQSGSVGLDGIKSAFQGQVDDGKALGQLNGLYQQFWGRDADNGMDNPWFKMLRSGDVSSDYIKNAFQGQVETAGGQLSPAAASPAPAPAPAPTTPQANYDWANLTPLGYQQAIAAGGNPNQGSMPSAGAGAVPGYYDNNVGPTSSGGQYNFATQNLTNWSPQQFQNSASAANGSDMYTSPWSRFADASGNPLAAFKDGNNFRVFKDPGDMGGTGFSGQQLGKMAGVNYDVYDPTGKYLSNGTFKAEDGWKDENIGDALGVASIIAMAGGAAAAGLGSGGAGVGASAAAGGSAASEAAALGTLGGATAGTGTATGLGAGIGGMLGDSTAAGYAGLDAASTATLGGGASGAYGGGLGLSTEALGGAAAGAAGAPAGVPPPANPAVTGAGGAAGATGAAGAAGAGASLPSLGQAGSLVSLINQLTGGGGAGSAGGAGGLGGLINSLGGNNGLAGLLGLLGGANDASQQGKAAQEMKSWLQGQQAKIDSAYNPGTPEYNALWDEMSRKDAAAGRNSQYGPRSVDLAAKLAGLKMNATTQFTTGTSRAYADALNQNASKYAGLSAAAQRALAGGGTGAGGAAAGGVSNLTSLLQALSNGTPNNLGGGITMNPDGSFAYNADPSTAGSYGTMSNDDIWNMINGGGSGGGVSQLGMASNVDNNWVDPSWLGF